MRGNSIRYALAVLSATVGFCREVRACDVCALYTAVQVESPIPHAFRLSVAEQFTSLDKVQQDGHYVENTYNQFLKSSVSQVSGQYDLNQSVSFQAVVPVVSRTWRRIEDGEVQRGSDAGIGDINLLAHYVPLNYSQGDILARLRVFGGVELPTGDAHYLGEESAPGHHGEDGDTHHDEGGGEQEDEHGDTHGDGHEDTGHHNVSLKHNGTVHAPQADNAIHGHDITLGSGSWDFPLGAGLFSQWGRYIWATDAQYTIRTEGAFDYKFANDWIWSTAIGRYLYLEDNAQVALRARLSGQYKGYDTGAGGVRYDDTAFNGTFLGPEVTALVTHRWQGVLGYDMPISVHNSDLQITPTYRIRAAITYRF